MHHLTGQLVLKGEAGVGVELSTDGDHRSVGADHVHLNTKTCWLAHKFSSNGLHTAAAAYPVL
ncbi:hypothetical protein TNCT1_61000 [Streptomyces sp. 1-11]|nr:hypothetical protein TNCT1_61000 [Streptomyces sp. 1-11]